jgi:transposase
MPHGNARLTVHGRQLLVDRVSSGRPVAHVAKEVGVSRQCAHRWVARYAAEGEAGLQDRSSRPQRSPRRTSPAVEAAVVGARRKYRLPQQSRPCRRTCPLAGVLQHSTPTHRTWRLPANQPTVTNLLTGYI